MSVASTPPTMKSSSMFSMLLTIPFLLSVAVAQGPVRCGQQCSFRLCRANEFLAALPQGARLRPGAPGDAIPPFICNLDGTLSAVVKTGEPMIKISPSIWTPLKTWRAARPSFPKKFFFSKTIPTLRKTAITYKKPVGNQYSLLDNACIKVPILRATENGVRVNRRKPTSCVSFRMVTPKLQVTVFWNTDDDVDMRVIQPNTQTVAWGSPSAFGELLQNNGFQLCRRIKVATELVVFPEVYLTGLYKVVLKIRNKCKLVRRNLRYTITVALNGKLHKKCMGMSTSRKGDFATCLFNVST